MEQPQQQQHQQLGKIEIGVDENGNQLPIEEVWDDTALVESWEEAVEEYRKYHSIDAKGEDKDAIIQAALEASGHAEPKPKIIGPSRPVDAMDTTEPTVEPSKEQGEGNEDEEEYVPPEDITFEDAPEDINEEAALEHAKKIVIPDIPVEMLQQSEATGSEATPQQPGPLAGVPEMLAQATAGNEELKSLMMAWYWAGYYTGLHEGQSRAKVAQKS